MRSGRLDGRQCDIHPYRKGRKMMQASARVADMYMHEDLDTQLHTHIHT